MSPLDIVKCFSNARLVISVEGSHQSHAVIAMPSGGVLLTIQPPTGVNLAAYKFFCDYKDIRSAFIIGDRTKDGFDVDITRLSRLLEIVSAFI